MILSDDAGSWPIVGSTDLFRNDWVMALRSDRIHPPHDDSTQFNRLVFEHPGASIVLALDADERVCLLRQYRHPAAGTFIELPAGLCDVAGEDPVETAKRELLEEAGLEATSWTHLLSTYPSAGVSSERHHLFLARDLTAVDTDYVRHHEEALMEVFWAPFATLYDAVLDGRVSEAPIAIAVLAYEALRRR